MADEKRQPERRSLAGAYLDQAADALHASGSSDALYGDVRHSAEVVAHALSQLLAPNKRLEFSRTAVLFAAIAAEAYINAFIFEPGRFARPDREALDRLPTIDKFVLAPRLAGITPMRRGREPITTLKTLFDLRNALVHPKPELMERGSVISEEPHGFDRFNPEAAAQVIVAVSDAALKLALATKAQADFTALLFWDGRHKLRAYGRRARTQLPSVTDKPHPDFYSQLTRARRKKRGQT